MHLVNDMACDSQKGAIMKLVENTLNKILEKFT